MKTIRLIVGLVSILCVLGFLTSLVSAQTDYEYEIFELVNRERSRSRLDHLEWNDELARVARNFSRQMAREGFFSHADRNGRTVVQRAGDARWSKIGENLFMCARMDDFTAFSVRGWMRSPSHRKNILDREWTDTGIGVFRTRDDKVFVTQVFIRR
jgi:uncharacterized protein YkwD